MLQHSVLARRQRQRERLDDARGEVVLEFEDVAERQLRGLGPDERAARRFNELRAHAKLLAGDRKSTRLNSSHGYISYAVFCLKKKKQTFGCWLTPSRSATLR